MRKEERDGARNLGKGWESVVLGKQFQGLWLLSNAHKGGHQTVLNPASVSPMLQNDVHKGAFD